MKNRLAPWKRSNVVRASSCALSSGQMERDSLIARISADRYFSRIPFRCLIVLG
jgi:hypothetical protein